MKCVSKRFQRILKNVLRAFPARLKDFQAVVKDVSRVLNESFKKIFRVFQSVSSQLPKQKESLFLFQDSFGIKDSLSAIVFKK